MRYRYTTTDPDGFVHVRYLRAANFAKACEAAQQYIPWYELLLGVDHVTDEPQRREQP